MAQKVEIDIPGIGKILAENAASEHTLEEILKVMQGMQRQLKSSQGSNNKAPQPGKAPGGAPGGAPGASAAGNKAQAQQTQQTGKSSKGLTALGIAAGAGAAAFSKVTTGAGLVAGSFLSLTQSAFSAASQLASMGNSLTAAASSFSMIPVVGPMLAGVFGAVAAAAEKQLGSFQQLASVGATFGGSMNAMTNAASGAGLTVDQFAKIVSSNGQAMAELGGTTEDGAKRFADLGKKMRQSGLGDELLRLGYSTEGINKGMAGYLATMGSSGRLQGASTTQLAQGAATYMKELDGLSKITGQNREDLAKEREKLAKDAQVEAAMQHLDEKQRSDMLTYIQSFPKAQQSAIKDMLATGTITSEEGVKMAAMYPKLASQMQAHGRTLQAGGQISKEAMNTTRNSGIEEARERNKTLKSVGQFNKEMGDTYSGGAELARQKINGLSQATDEQAATIKKANQAEELEKSKQKLAEFSNAFSNFLASSGLIDEMMSAMDTLAEVVGSVLVPITRLFVAGLQYGIDIVKNYVMPAFRILADFVTIGVVPIIEKLGGIIGSMLNPLLESTGGVLGLFETSLYVVSDFIEDNLEPILATFLGVMIGLTAAKVIATIAAWASAAADTARTLAAWGSAAADTAKAAASLPFIASLVAMAAGVWTAVAPFLLVAAGVLVVVGVVALLTYGIVQLVKYVGSLGLDFKVLGDAFSYVGSLIKTSFLTIFKGVLSVLDKITFGDTNKKIQEALLSTGEKLNEETDKRGKLADDMSKQMKENQTAAAKAAADKKTADEKTAAAKKAADEKDAAAAAALNKALADKKADADKKAADAERAALRISNPAEAKKLDARDKRDAAIAAKKEQREKDLLDRKKQAELKAIGDKTAAEKKAAEAKTETKEVDISGPQAMLKSFSEQQNGFFANNIKAAQEQQEKEKAVAAIRTEYQEAEKKYAEAKTDEEKKATGESLTAAGKRLETAKKEKEEADKKAGKLVSAPGTAGGGGGGGAAGKAPAGGGAGGGGAGGGGIFGKAGSAAGSAGGGGSGSSGGGSGSSSGGGKDGGVDGSGGGGDGGKLPAMAKSAGGKGGSMSEPDIKAMITRHEGIRYEPYKDSLGLWTVGVGHLIGDGKTLPQEYNRKFSHEEVMAMFDKDYEKHKKQAESNVPGYSKFDSLGQAALIDLTFNMGPGWPKKFPNTSKKLAAGDTAGAAAGLTDSAWYGQVGKRAPVITGMVRDSKVTARDGGIFDGPKSGFDAELHGTEAVVPLPDGNKIPVTFSNMPKAPDLGTSMKVAYNQLRAQLDSVDFLRSGDSKNTFSDTSPELIDKTEMMRQKLSDMAATLQGQGIDAAAEYNAPEPGESSMSSVTSLLKRLEMADATSSVSGPEANAANKGGSRGYDNSNDVETQTGKQSLGQDDSVSQLSSLNSKLEQLISINHQLANINNDQLRVQKGFSFGDMFKSPV